MGRERRAILEVLASIADLGVADWTDETLRNVSRPAVGGLRLISRVAEAQRTISETSRPPVDNAASSGDSSQPPASDTGSSQPDSWGPLKINTKIGEGTFAKVYRAYDPKLEIDVALKLFKSMALVDSDRALREARMLARVRHENVVRVYGVDTHDGCHGIWMELVCGLSLDALVAARGTFSAREAALVGQDLCRALAAVHAAQLTHGDLKPQNVLREDGGRLVLMDFSAGRRRDVQHPQAVAGTPMFLCPEVLAGSEPAPSSDIYSLGVLLYYLVTGNYPYPAESLGDLRTLHQSASFVPLHDHRPDLPDAFVRIVQRAIAPVATERFDSAGHMQAALAASLGDLSTVEERSPGIQRGPRPHSQLRRVFVAITLAAAAMLFIFLRADERPPAPVASTPQRAVAILPFRPLQSDDQSLSYSQGLSEDLTARLGGLATVRVVSGAFVRRYGGTDRSLAQICHDLNVASLVDGSVRVLGDRLLVAVELVDCNGFTQLWGQTFERPLAEVLSVQNQLIQGVAAGVRGTLSADDKSRLRHDGDARAFGLYLTGRYHWNTRTDTNDGTPLSIKYFQEAIARDPRFALAHAGLADAYVSAAFYHIEKPSSAHPKAESAALEAIGLDPYLPQAHAAFGVLRLNQFRWNEAEDSLRRALDLNPSYASARHWLALWLAQRGRLAEAQAEMRAARAVEPGSNALAGAIGYIHMLAGEYEEARREFGSVLDAHRDHFQALTGIIETEAARGAIQSALNNLADAQRLTTNLRDLQILKVTAAYVYALSGDRDRSKELLSEVESTLEDTHASEAEIASVHAALGDVDLAFQWLDRAVVNGDTLLGYLAVDPRYKPLRNDPRFAAILQRLDLPAH